MNPPKIIKFIFYSISGILVILGTLSQTIKLYIAGTILIILTMLVYKFLEAIEYL